MEAIDEELDALAFGGEKYEGLLRLKKLNLQEASSRDEELNQDR